MSTNTVVCDKCGATAKQIGKNHYLDNQQKVTKGKYHMVECSTGDPSELVLVERPCGEWREQ